ncbi:MAG: hypothetical protein KDA80_03990 [Planctomycetaceae bacterium]|nr:hypothetical protein [Planctomycetaceae bacterium]
MRFRTGLICVAILLNSTLPEAVCGEFSPPLPAPPVPAAVDDVAPSDEGSESPIVEPDAASEESSSISAEIYGSLWGSMSYATSRTSPGEFTLWVFPEDVQGEPAWNIDARRSRLGVNVVGPDLKLLNGLETAGQLEFDFFGQFITENRAGARLRQAWWEARNSDYRFLIGQTWDVISPRAPGTLNFSVGWNGGNIGFRRAQVRLERFLHMNQCSQVILQGSLNQDIVADFPTEPGIRRETAGWPVAQGRLAFLREESGTCLPDLEFGLSGHFGETGFDFLTPGPPPLNLPPADDVRVRTWSWNLDARLVWERFSLQGEFFQGSNLSAFLGGIGQGVCPCVRRPIDSMGGWFEAVYDWNECWQTHVGFGIDDPDDRDSLLGRTLNRFLFGNLIWQISDGLRTGMEVTWWTTESHETRIGQVDPALLTSDIPGRSLVVEWMLRYDF